MGGGTFLPLLPLSPSSSSHRPNTFFLQRDTPPRTQLQLYLYKAMPFNTMFPPFLYSVDYFPIRHFMILNHDILLYCFMGLTMQNSSTIKSTNSAFASRPTLKIEESTVFIIPSGIHDIPGLIPKLSLRLQTVDSRSISARKAWLWGNNIRKP